MDNLQYIIEHVPAAARIEQLAEEAAELPPTRVLLRVKPHTEATAVALAALRAP